MGIFDNIILTRPGNSLHDTRHSHNKALCETCGESTENDLQIKVVTIRHDSLEILFCVPCWQAITRRIEYFAENPEATLP